MPLDLESQIQEILHKQKGLKYDGASTLFGTIPVSENDNYEVRIDVAPFPQKLPHVHETGDRIPQDLDRHKYKDSDQCCLTTEAKGQILIKTEITSLPIFVTRMVVPYFQNNSYYEINAEYLQGEYSHGTMGVIEGYQDILGVKNPRIIQHVMGERLMGVKLKIRDFCYCGSGRRLKRCHDAKYRQFRLIDLGTLTFDYQRTSELIREYDLRHR